jgi:hypothetical protein
MTNEQRRWYRLLEKERVRQRIDPLMGLNEPLAEFPGRYNGVIEHLRRMGDRIRRLEKESPRQQ